MVIQADLTKTLSAVAAACDLVHLRLQNHSERTAYLALRIGVHLGLDKPRLKLLVLSALLHDIGIISTKEKLELADFQPAHVAVTRHAQRGYDLLMATRYLQSLALPVLQHHDYYRADLDIIPAILFVADRAENLLRRDQYYLFQVDQVVERIRAYRETVFHPEVVDALTDLAPTPSLWLDLQTANYVKFIQDNPDMTHELGLDELDDIAKLFATIVDSKSPFTATHSSGLAAKAAAMATKLGMDQTKVRQMRIAALLHDIGKLAVPEEILLSPGKLTPEEMAVMKQHTYHTYHLIGMIGKGVESIQRWAAFHHERLDGSGYPFGLSADQLDSESRLLAILDVFQALTENRPYRPPLSLAETAAILRKEAAAGRLDQDLVELVLEHAEELLDPAD